MNNPFDRFCRPHSPTSPHHHYPHSITPSLHHSLTPSLPHSLTPSLPHSLTPSLPHSLTPSSLVLSFSYMIVPSAGFAACIYLRLLKNDRAIIMKGVYSKALAASLSLHLRFCRRQLLPPGLHCTRGSVCVLQYRPVSVRTEKGKSIVKYSIA